MRIFSEVLTTNLSLWLEECEFHEVERLRFILFHIPTSWHSVQPRVVHEQILYELMVEWQNNFVFQKFMLNHSVFCCHTFFLLTYLRIPNSKYLGIQTF